MATTVRPATAEDLVLWMGKMPEQSVRAFVAEEDGEAMGLAAIVYDTDLQVIFCISEELRKRKRTLVRAAREFRKILNIYNLPLYAVASEEEPTAPGFLEWVGFENVTGGLYRWARPPSP